MGDVVPLRPGGEPASGSEQLAEDEPVLVVDLGAQYAQLIARRVRDCRVYSELVSASITPARGRASQGARDHLSGGPASVYAPGAPRVDPELLGLGVPVLGICYGMQWMAQALGGEVERTDVASTAAPTSGSSAPTAR